jgi:sigma-B regulation protein RsbU (phosphoserine phosphatase)
MSDEMQTRNLVHELRCEEVWGGTEATETMISVPGIDAWVYSRPYKDESAGGDIHYIGLCGHGIMSRFVVADVAGHGREVAELARTLRGLLARHMNTPDMTELVRAMNDEFNALGTVGRFATALTLTYIATEDHLLMVNAGHPRPLWHSTADGDWTPLDSQVPESERGFLDLPLGVIEGTGYHQFAVPLDKGDLLVLYSDSLTEAEDGRGEMLGQAGLLDLAAGCTARTPNEFGHELLGRVGDYRGGRPSEDDITLLVLHHNAADPPAVPDAPR